jgi:hypothetical protein
VPKKSKMPIIASTLAAATGTMPKSPQSETKCVCTSPLVLAPQMKKVAKSTQKVGEPEASRSATSGEASIARKPRSGGAATISSEP